MAKRGLLGFDVTDTAREKPKGGAFLWTVVLLILTGMAMASWIGSFYIVAHPENPRCYRILKKLKRLDPPRQFQVTDEGPPKKFVPAPVGKFLTPKTALDFYGRMGPKELGQKNAELLRMYVKNYGESKTPVSYMTGVFEVVEAHPLTGTDFFPSGVVAVTQARDYPQVLMEMVFPANQASVKTILGILPVGREITLERSKDLAAILHVDRMADSRLQFTTVPISYGSFQLKDGRGSFTLKSPKDLEDPEKGGSPNNGLRIEAPLPIVDGIRLQKGLNAHAEYRRKVMAGSETERPKSDPLVAARSTDAAKDPQEIATPVVIREAPAQAPVTPAPATQVARQTPAPRSTTSIIQSPTPKPALITSSVPTQLPERFPLPPRPVVRATPGPVAPVEVVKPAAPTPEPEPPKPVVISRPPVAPPIAAETPKPAAEAQPVTSKKRVLSTKEASAMVDNFDPAAGATLGGEFVVTAVLDQRVALRASESLRDRDADPTQPGSSGAMIVVDFPKGVAPPAKDLTFSRNGDRGFVIKSIRRAGSGQITILAEEPVKP